MDWWKKIVQIGQKVLGGDVKNPHGLDGKFIEGVGIFLDPVQEVDPELALCLLRYVVDGSDEDAIGKLGANAKAVSSLNRPNSTGFHASTGRMSTLFRASGAVAPDVWVRLGTLIDQSARMSNQANTFTMYQRPPGLPDWLSIVLCEMSMNDYYHHTDERYRPHRRSIFEFEKVLEAEDHPGDAMVKPLLENNWSFLFFGGYYDDGTRITLTDNDKYLAKHTEKVRDILKQCNSDERVHAFKKLVRFDFDFSPFINYLVQLGTGTSKTVRETVLPLLRKHPDAARPHLEQVLKDGDAGARSEAATVLYRLFGADVDGVLKTHLQTEKSDRVKQTIDKLLISTELESAAAEVLESFNLPPLKLETGIMPVPDSFAGHLRKHFDDMYEFAYRNYEQLQKAWDSPQRAAWMTKPVKPEKVKDSVIKDIVDFVEGRNDKKDKPLDIPLDNYYALHQAPKDIEDWLVPSDYKLMHLVRIMFALKLFELHAYGNREPNLWWRNSAVVESYRSKCEEKFGLRELDAALAIMPGYTTELVAKSYMLNSMYGGGSYFDWEPEAIWPLYAEKETLIRNTLLARNVGSDYSSYDWYLPQKRQTAFKILSMFPQLPPNYVALLWDMAVGETKTDRRPAQDALHTVPGKIGKIVHALGDGKQGVRAAAAEWLGRLGDKSAIEPLKTAFLKEKQETTKGVIMQALDNLEADVDEFLNRDKLLTESKAGLAKKRPKGMEWLPLETLPILHWQDTGNQVDPAIVQWWVVQSVQQKSPSCGPILRRYLSMCRPAEAEKFAQTILGLWIGYDTETVPFEQASERAKADADTQWAAYSQHAYYVDVYKNKDNLYKALLATYSAEMLHSAIDQKGLLAIVSAAGDSECVKMCDKYIRKYYGNKLAHCKALIEVLSWIEHPLALQALLAFANRFRTKAVKQLAEQLVNEIAERQGWTLDELADRTIPDAGFARPVDEDGNPVGTEAVLELDFGPRQFEVRLNDKLETVIVPKGETKALKALPAPGKSDDEALAKEAKKDFSDAKKVAKEVVKRQSERLYEALCTQRSWSFADWNRFLAQHPIVGRLCVRLAWAAYEPPAEENGERKFIGCFRPLEDGSLTNENDEEVKLADDAIVTLAHSCNVPDTLAAAWIKHFDDYDVTPLFQQFGRAAYVLPEGKEKLSDVTDFEGHMITTYKLRNKAVKLGYLRGDAEDGGCFVLYRKPFAALSLQAVIEFTGSSLPEEDVPAALKEMYFVTMSGKDGESFNSWQPGKVILSKVPAVLLSECYNDLKQIAAEGSGFDPKWQEKSYF